MVDRDAYWRDNSDARQIMVEYCNRAIQEAKTGFKLHNCARLVTGAGLRSVFDDVLWQRCVDRVKDLQLQGRPVDLAEADHLGEAFWLLGE